MTKVVYNACFGGFGLSDAAIKRLCELAPEYTAEPSDEKLAQLTKNHITLRGKTDREVPRHHPALVQVVEEMADAASGRFSKLRIAEVRSMYRIDEYDGSETVMEPDGYEWVTP